MNIDWGAIELKLFSKHMNKIYSSLETTNKLDKIQYAANEKRNTDKRPRIVLYKASGTVEV